MVILYLEINSNYRISFTGEKSSFHVNEEFKEYIEFNVQNRMKDFDMQRRNLSSISNNNNNNKTNSIKNNKEKINDHKEHGVIIQIQDHQKYNHSHYQRRHHISNSVSSDSNSIRNVRIYLRRKFLYL